MYLSMMSLYSINEAEGFRFYFLYFLFCNARYYSNKYLNESCTVYYWYITLWWTWWPNVQFDFIEKFCSFGILWILGFSEYWPVYRMELNLHSDYGINILYPKRRKHNRSPISETWHQGKRCEINCKASTRIRWKQLCSNRKSLFELTERI